MLNATHTSSIRSLCLSTSFFVTASIRADILGSFEATDPSPGYIDLDSNSSWFQGIANRSVDASDAIEYRSPAQIVASYFPDGYFVPAKIDLLLKEVADHEENSWLEYCRVKAPAVGRDLNECRSPRGFSKLRKKWRKKKIYTILQYAKRAFKQAREAGHGILVSQLNTSSKGQYFVGKLFRALNLLQALKEEDEQRGRNSGANNLLLNIAPNMLAGSIEIKAKRVEAANLAVPKAMRRRFSAQNFLSSHDLNALEREGVNIATIDPIDSGMWRRPRKAVRNFDVTNYDLQGLDSLARSLGKRQALAMLDANSPVDIIYDARRKMGGTTPKIYGKIGKQKWKIKLLVDKYSHLQTTNLQRVFELLLNAAEVNVEHVVNNLAAALGFTVDPCYYKKKVRLFFADSVYEEDGFEHALRDMYKDLEILFPDQNRFMKAALSNVKVDSASQRRYIEIIGASLEKKSDKDTDINVGFFNRDTLGRDLMREHRAFTLFLAWIGDPDVKDDNTKVKIIPQVDGDFELAYSNSDMGGALGHGMPNFFSHSFVVKVKRYLDGTLKKVKFRNPTLYKNQLAKAISFKDCEWLVRRIAQFSLAQFDQAFLRAGFPQLIAKIYARKLMSRRNELVRVFGYVGRTITDDEGNKLTVKLEEGFNGLVPGYEKYFKSGYLQDPDNELFDPSNDPFPRHWSAYWSPSIKGRPQRLFWKHMSYMLLNEGSSLLVNAIEPGLYYTDNDLGFSSMGLLDGNLGDCSACYFQGVRAGVGTFLPFRFILDNPDGSSSKPFLVVDLFRLGFQLNSNISPVLEKLGLAKSIVDSGVGVGVQGFHVFEFIKIKSVESISPYSENYRPSKTMRLTFSNARRHFVDTMQPQESLIVSRYTGVRAQLFANLPSNEYSWLLSPEIVLGAGGQTHSRVVVHKPDHKTFLVNWNSGASGFVRAAARLRALLPFTILRLARHRSMVVDNSYVFDATNSSEKAVLLDNLTLKRPKGVPMKFGLRHRRAALSQDHAGIGFGSLIRRDRFLRNSDTLLYDFSSGERSQELAFEREVSYRKMKRLNVKSRSYSYKASINNKNDAFFRIKMLLHQPEGRKRHFLDIMEKIAALVPHQFILFDPNAVKEYLGDIDFEGILILSNAGLDRLFSLDHSHVCQRYASMHGLRVAACLDKNYWQDSDLWAFMREFSRAHYSYMALKFSNHRLYKGDHQQKTKVMEHLSNLVAFFYRYNRKHHIFRLFARLLPNTSFYNRAWIRSDLNGFPHDNGLIELHKSKHGNFAPSLRHLADSPEDAFAIFSDMLVERLSSRFYIQ